MTSWSVRSAALAAVTLLSIGIGVRAQQVEYTLSSTGVDTWRYDYSIRTSAASPSFDELTIYFAKDAYSGIALGAAPAGWDPLVIQPDLAIPSDGFFDVLLTSGAVPPSSFIGGFSVTFTYLAGMTPGAQPFDLIDSGPFDVVHSGLTVPLAVTAVPEPETALLLLMGTAVLLTRLRKRRSRWPRASGLG